MELSTNALAELAGTIEEIKGLSVIRTMIHDKYTVALEKAQRIVAELAKVEDNMLNTSCTVAMLMRCRAIAEEGES